MLYCILFWFWCSFNKNFRFFCKALRFVCSYESLHRWYFLISAMWFNNWTIYLNNHKCSEICGLKTIFLLQCFIWNFKYLSCVHLQYSIISRSGKAQQLRWVLYVLFLLAFYYWLGFIDNTFCCGIVSCSFLSSSASSPTTMFLHFVEFFIAGKQQKETYFFFDSHAWLVLYSGYKLKAKSYFVKVAKQYSYTINMKMHIY